MRLLDKQGIWEPADKGNWAHSLVTPVKSDGTVRITTDLSRFNKYVILMCFDVLMPAEIFQMVHGSSFLSTLDLIINLECMLQCLHANNFCLQLNKGRFHKIEVPFLGHVLSGTELHPSLTKVEAITGAPALTNVLQLSSFPGLVTYIVLTSWDTWLPWPNHFVHFSEKDLHLSGPQSARRPSRESRIASLAISNWCSMTQMWIPI